eukprot:6197469-Pleurochrysis_carterae.AAC.5
MQRHQRSNTRREAFAVSRRRCMFLIPRHSITLHTVARSALPPDSTPDSKIKREINMFEDVLVQCGALCYAYAILSQNIRSHYATFLDVASGRQQACKIVLVQ